MHCKLSFGAAGLFLFSFLAAGTVVLAHSGATGIVKHRMDVMGDIGKAMKTIGLMIRDKAPFDRKQVEQSAETIAAHAEKVPDLFPDASNTGPSEALPAIWEDWDGFLAINDEMRESADALATVARSASVVAEIKGPFGVVAKTCSSCHEKFRLKKQ